MLDRQILRRLSAVSSFAPQLIDEAFEGAVSEFRLGAGELLLQRGERDDAFLILVEGTVEILSGSPPVIVATAGPGAMLGEMAVFGGEVTRRATVRTRTDIVGVVFSKEGLDTLRDRGHLSIARLEAQAAHAVCSRLRVMNERISHLARGTSLEGAPPDGLLDRLRDLVGWARAEAPPPAPDPLTLLQGSSMFGGLSPRVLAGLAADLEMESFPDGEVVIAEGTFGQDAWIVGSGKIGVYRAVASQEDERITGIEPGQMLGVVGMMHGSSRTASCIAEEPSWLLRISGETFRRHASGPDEVARLLRRAAFDGLSDQLTRANEKVALLITALSEDMDLGADERAAYGQLVMSAL